ncbi:MAG: hypothetical protein ACK5PP_02315 [Acidimicrobiales bacterium]
MMTGRRGSAARAAVGVLLVVLAVVVSPPMSAEGLTAQGSPSFPDGLVWLALGDSYLVRRGSPLRRPGCES